MWRSPYMGWGGNPYGGWGVGGRVANVGGMLVGDTNGDGVIDHKDVANTLRASRMAGAWPYAGGMRGWGGVGNPYMNRWGLGGWRGGLGGWGGYRGTSQVKNMGGVLVGDTNGDGVVDSKDLVNTLAGRGVGVGAGAGWGGYGGWGGRWGGYRGGWGGYRGAWGGYRGVGVGAGVARVGGMLVGDTNGDGVIDYKDVANTLRASRMAGAWPYAGGYGGGYGGLYGGYGGRWGGWRGRYGVGSRVGMVNGMVVGDTNGDGVIDSTDVTNTVIARANALL